MSDSGPASLSRTAAAEWLGISLRGLDRLVASRQIRHRKIGQRITFRPEDLVEFIDERTIDADAP